jgi:cytochrome P450
MISKPTLPSLDLFERHFQRFQTKLRDGPDKDQNINLKPHLYDLSFDTIVEFLLGPADSLDDVSHQSDWTQDFAEKFILALRWIAKRERLKIFYWFIDGPEFRMASYNARKILSKAIERSILAVQRSHNATDSYIALEELLHDKENTPFIRDQVLNFLLAGRDTSGSFLCWIIYTLAHEPNIVQALKAEMDDVFGAGRGKPSKEDLGRLTKLDRFLTEGKLRVVGSR